MSEIGLTESFEERRKMMKNVEDIIAKAEANYGVNYDDEVHVSDVSTSSDDDSESEEIDQKVNVTKLFDSSMSDESIGSKYGKHIGSYRNPQERKEFTGARSLAEEINLETITVTTQKNNARHLFG